MAGSAAKVVLSERQQKVLRKLSTASTKAKRLVQHASIILLAFSGVDNQDIAKEVGLGRNQGGPGRGAGQPPFQPPPPLGGSGCPRCPPPRPCARWRSSSGSSCAR